MPYFAEGTGIPMRAKDAATPHNDNTTGAEAADAVRVKNRRKTYLDKHPEYFGPQLELADPLLYDRLIRRFQTAAERESEGRKKGYSGVLEADLYRSEAKLDALRHPDPHSMFTYRRGADGEILAEDRDEVPRDKEDGYARWRWEMEARFLRGGDEDFDYGTVDGSEEFDDKVLEERDAEDRYFDGETPQFVGGEDGQRDARDGGKEELKGETGVQDF